MLEELSVRNFALAENVTISFEDGLNILTGETGAGKSIIVGALSFLLGSKAAQEIIRTGAQEAAVSAVIRVRPDNRDVLDWLTAHGIETDEGRLIVRRSVRQGGRASIYIQSLPATRNDLAECMEKLFDIHGQHAHEGLLKKDVHRRYLDRFAGIEAEALAFNAVFQELSAQRKALETQAASKREREERAEILAWAVDEIDKAALRSGECRELETEAARLESFEKLSGHVEAAAEALYEEERSVLGLARKFHISLEAASALDGSLGEIEQRAAALYYEAEDLASELRSYHDTLEFDPERLEVINERLSVIYKLEKKYAGKAALKVRAAAEDAILSYREEAAAELATLSGAEEGREKLRAEIAAQEKDIARRAASLSAKRREAARRLGEAVSAILPRLGMKGARFEVALAAKGGKGQGTGESRSQSENPLGAASAQPTVLGPWGADDVEFLISANTGEPLRELARIASGGELSRVMLAIKTALSGADTIETLIFDEIDTGIGGEVALAVGEYLAKIGKTRQIFCVTHLASIAVRADNHLLVEKHSDAQRTLTTVTALKGERRGAEIARMLSGDTGPVAKAHAAELLARYGRQV